jgi:aspartate/methionine/tyrosine aminotransferase
MTEFQLANRIQSITRNVFADMDRCKALAKQAGKETIDLSLGSSDLSASSHVIEAIEHALHDPTTHGYLLHQETQEFRIAAAQWYNARYGVFVNPETEILSLIGSQEGTAHLPLAILNESDFALLLDPGYPSHAGGVALAGGQIYPMPMRIENDFLPVLEDIPVPVLERAKMMVLSYPHNPTTAIAPLAFFEKAVSFCREHQLVLVHDFPYFDIVFDADSPAPSILQADPNKDVSIEFYTFSKSYNMGGFRIGFAVGNAQLISALRRIKAVVDFNQYRGILTGAIAALQGPQNSVQETITTYQKRRDFFVKALHQIGWEVPTPSATLYIWAKLPHPWENRSVEFCTQLIQETGVAVSPGAGFGKAGEGYVRFALVHEPDVLEKAVERIAAFLKHQENQ